MDPDDSVLDGDTVLVKVWPFADIGVYDELLKLNTRGTPTSPELRVAVTVIADEPAV